MCRSGLLQRSGNPKANPAAKLMEGEAGGAGTCAMPQALLGTSFLGDRYSTLWPSTMLG